MPSVLVIRPSVPLATVTSRLLLKSATASLKVIVTVDVSPTLSAVSLMVIVAVGAVVSAVNVTVLLAVLLLPAASVNLVLATLTEALVPPAIGVKVAVYVVPEPVKLLNVPPVTETSSATKSVLDSDSVNVIVAVSPDFSALLSAVIATVGTTVSTARVSVLLESAPSILALPVASVNLPLAMLTTPFVVLLAIGVKVAVYVAPEPVKLLNVPPLTSTSAEVKSVLASDNAKVNVVVSPALRADLSAVIATVGGAVSTVKLCVPLPVAPYILVTLAAMACVPTASAVTAAAGTVRLKL